MELIFKLPKDKLPFLGIVFESMSQAAKLNSELVDNRQEADYKIKLEPIRDNTINMVLYSFSPTIRKEYKEMRCDLNKMEQWLNLTKYNNAFNFSHLIKEFDREMVVKTSPGFKLWVLKVSKVDLIYM